MATRIREKLWRCSDCDTGGIRGRLKECPNCGSPREKGEMKSLTGQGASAPAVTDPDLIARAMAGSDWFCTHCTSGNAGDGNACSKCGAPRYAQPEEDHPDFQGDHHRVEDAGTRRERETGAPARTPPLAPASFPAPSRRGAILAAIGIGLLAWIFVWASSTHDVRGVVTAMTWTRTVHVESWEQVTKSLWKHQTTERTEIPPSYGSGGTPGLALVPGSCRAEQFDTERYICGSHKVCRDVTRTVRESYSCQKSETYVCGETCRDLGNGFESCSDKHCSRSVPGTCTRSKEVFDHQECHKENDYCTRPIMRDKCEYRSQAWQDTSSYPTSGSGTDFRWADVHLDQLDRATYSASYHVTYAYDSGQQNLDTVVERGSKAAAEVGASRGPTAYSTWKVGDPVAITINNLGGIVSVSHAP